MYKDCVVWQHWVVFAFIYINDYVMSIYCKVTLKNYDYWYKDFFLHLRGWTSITPVLLYLLQVIKYIA